jgi:hypothetical protein
MKILVPEGIRVILFLVGHQWLIPVILATWEAEVWRIRV